MVDEINPLEYQDENNQEYVIDLSQQKSPEKVTEFPETQFTPISSNISHYLIFGAYRQAKSKHGQHPSRVRIPVLIRSLTMPGRVRPCD